MTITVPPGRTASTTHFIGGAWTAPAARTFAVTNPLDDQVVADASAGGAAEAAAAVAAAAGAFPGWAALNPAAR